MEIKLPKNRTKTQLSKEVKTQVQQSPSGPTDSYDKSRPVEVHRKFSPEQLANTLGFTPILGSAFTGIEGFRKGRDITEKLVENIPSKSLRKAAGLAGGVVGGLGGFLGTLAMVGGGIALCATGFPLTGVALFAIGTAANTAVSKSVLPDRMRLFDSVLGETCTKFRDSLAFVDDLVVEASGDSIGRYEFTCKGGAKLEIKSGDSNVKVNGEPVSLKSWSVKEESISLESKSAPSKLSCTQKFKSNGECEVSWAEPSSGKHFKVTRKPNGPWGPVFESANLEQPEWNQTDRLSNQSGTTLMLKDDATWSDITRVNLAVDPALVTG